MKVLWFQLLNHVQTISKIKMKRMSTAAVLCVQNVEIQRAAINHQIASVAIAETTFVVVSIDLSLKLETKNCLLLANASCGDSIKNQDETDVDCGGTRCPKCADTKNCNQSSDCISNFCNNNHICTGRC